MLFFKVEKLIENADEKKLQEISLLLDKTQKLPPDEVIKLKEYIEVRRQILWFDSLPDYKPNKSEIIKIKKEDGKSIQLKI